MKRLSVTISATLVCVGLLALLGGCGKQETEATTAAAGFKPSGRATPIHASAQANSFDRVSAHLDPGGDFYLYLGTEQWLQGLSKQLTEFRQLLTSMPNMSNQEKINMGHLMDFITILVKNSGVEDVTAIGASGIQIEKGIYLNKVILHHYPGKNDGLLWTAFGKEPHPLTGLDYLPSKTALASFADLDAPLLWKTIKDQAQQANIPELTKGMQELSANLERAGINLDSWINSLGGELGFILTLDPDHPASLPRGPNSPKIEIPEPAMAVMLKVKDDTIFKYFDKWFEKNPMAIKTDKKGLQMRSMAIPAPFTARATVAQAGDYLILASLDNLVTDILAVKDGDSKGLKSSAEFKKHTKGIALEGNSFSYLSPEIGRSVNHVISTIADFQSAAGARDSRIDLLERLLGDKDTFSFAVSANTKEGWFVQANSTQHPVTAFLGSTMAVPLAMGAATIMPNMARGRDRAQSIACVNNLKQIGLAARIWANDHGEVMPKDFQSMSNELNTPKILICPGDNKKTAATWAEFDFANASYEIVSPGIKTDDPTKVYARCPIHNNTCMVDGSVQQGGRRAGGGARRPR